MALLHASRGIMGRHPGKVKGKKRGGKNAKDMLKQTGRKEGDPSTQAHVQDGKRLTINWRCKE